MNQQSRPNEKCFDNKTKPDIPIRHSGNHPQKLLIYALCCAALASLMTLGSSAQGPPGGGAPAAAPASVPVPPPPPPADTSHAANIVRQAAKQGFPMSASLSVRDNAFVEAVLIPPKLAQKVFGKTVGNDYAVIALTISNRSSEAALIVHTIFIDYSHWLLSGGSPPSDNDSCGEQAGNPAETTGNASNSGPKRLSSAETCPNQIASVEYRIVRDQLQHDQPYTWRNWVIRSLELTGSIATAATFSIGSRHAIQAISAYTGEGIPAARTFWPDDTVAQLNNISDLAFRVNKVISKESSDIVVAFFPIDRFLTPGFKQWFIKSPALFFAPYAMLLDPKSPQEFKDRIDKLAPGAITLLEANSQYLSSGACDSEANVRQLIEREKISESAQANIWRTCRLGKLLQNASLNTVRIAVGGTMTVNVDNVPAKIDSVEITTSDNKPVSWGTVPQDLVGVIRGSFLSNAQPSIVNAEQLGITNLAAVSEGSSDKELHFKMTITKAVNEKKLTFKVVKKNASGANVESATYDYPIPAQTPQNDHH